MELKKACMVHGFRVIRGEYVTEIASQVYELQHEKSGARVLYIQNEDDNKVFSISFRTTPMDSTGVPHICCLLYTSPSPRDISGSRMPSSA